MNIAIWPIKSNRQYALNCSFIQFGFRIQNQTYHILKNVFNVYLNLVRMWLDNPDVTKRDWK